ncbi:MAG: hypothetical protein JWQ71_578 [Pedosphaera sp.]|nr:hypothetical protein [Pedosphaera sp.]
MNIGSGTPVLIQTSIYGGDDKITLTAFNAFGENESNDGFLFKTPIEILVYP